MSKKTKRLVVDVPEYLHRKIKIEATKRNMSINKFVVGAVLYRMAYKEKYDPVKN